MNEQETTYIAAEEDAILPDGYRKGDDYLNPDSWSGSADADGQTETGSETGSNEGTTAGNRNAAETPTTSDDGQTGTGAVSQDGENVDKTTPDAAAAESTDAPAKRALSLRVNHETREVDVNAMSDDDLRAVFQKAAAFDDAKRRKAYDEAYEKARADGESNDVAAMLAEHKTGYTPPAEEPTPVNELEAVRQFRAAVPDAPETLPPVVWDAIRNGGNPIAAYYQGAVGTAMEKITELEQRVEQLIKDKTILKANAAAAAKAPVRGITGGGKTQEYGPLGSDFERGMDAEY